MLPYEEQTAHDTMNSLQKFLLPGQTPGVVHTDSFLEFTRACKDLCWNHDKSTQHRSKTNGNAENAVRGVEDGTSALLFSQSLSEMPWREAMECICYMRNIQDKLADRKSPYERRFGTPFDGPIMPVGAAFSQYLRKTKVVSINLGQGCFQEYS